MTPQELFERLQAEIKTITWPSSANLVFGDEVFVVPNKPIKQMARWNSPTCFIIDQGSQFYTQHNELHEQNFTISVFVEHFGDSQGERSLLGGNRPANKSKGAGLFEIERVLVEHLRKVTALSSAKITLIGRAKAKQAFVERNTPFVFRDLTFRALVSWNTDTPAVPDDDDILRSPGLLYWAPSALSPGSFGTALGFTQNGILINFNINIVDLDVQDTGDEPIYAIDTGRKIEVVATLLNYNTTALARMIPGQTSGNEIRIPNSVDTGDDLALNSSIFSHLLFVPDDTTNNFIFILQKAVPRLVQPIRLSRDGDTAYQVEFTGYRKTDNVDGVFYMGPLANGNLR